MTYSGLPCLAFDNYDECECDAQTYDSPMILLHLINGECTVNVTLYTGTSSVCHIEEVHRDFMLQSTNCISVLPFQPMEKKCNKLLQKRQMTNGKKRIDRNTLFPF